MGLVLSRKIGERVFIGPNISVMPVRIGPNAVRFQIDAPRDMNIVREELVEHPIQESNEGLNDLGQRVIDPLGVADAYIEKEMIDHGV